MNPLISVIVPIYGVERYIGRCADSLLSQACPEVEFVFVNDGTPDGSMEVLREVAARYPEARVKIVEQANAGLPHARMAGLAVSEGTYIVHLDSDDWMEDGALKILKDKALESGADLIYYDFWKEYAHHSKLDHERRYDPSNKVRWMRRLYRDAAYGYVWSKMARRELYDGIFVPRLTMHEDIVFSTQLIWRAATIEQLSVPLVHYRRDNPQASTRMGRSRRRLQSARNMLELYANGGPEVAAVERVLLRKCFWNALRYDRSLFREYPALKRAYL